MDKKLIDSYSKEEAYLQLANENAKADHESAKALASRIKVLLSNDIIIKVLEAEKITIEKEVPTPKMIKNEKGEEVQEIDPITRAPKYDISIVEEEIDNPIREAIIIALPFKSIHKEEMLDYVVGERVLVSHGSAQRLFNGVSKNQIYHTVSPYNIIGRVKPDKVEMIEEKKRSGKNRNFKPETNE